MVITSGLQNVNDPSYFVFNCVVSCHMLNISDGIILINWASYSSTGHHTHQLLALLYQKGIILINCSHYSIRRHHTHQLLALLYHFRRHHTHQLLALLYQKVSNIEKNVLMRREFRAKLTRLKNLFMSLTNLFLSTRF